MVRFVFRLLPHLYATLILLSPVLADSREWTDSTGLYTVKATLIAYDTASVVLKVDQKANPKSHDLLVLPIDKLSKQDQEYLSSKEATEMMDAMQASQKWTMKNGMTVIGRVVDYARKDVTIQRRRGKVYVNDKLLTNLPEIYQKFIPKIVEHFDKVTLPDDKAFHDWMVKQKATPRQFHCEGVILEFENHEEYAFPFFFFSDKDLAMLQSGWEKWLAHEEEHEQKERDSFYLQAQAMEHQRHQEASQKMAMMQLELLAVGAGVTDLWEVTLEPGPRVRGYPQAVVVPARDSDQASYAALQKYPGYVLGPVRKLSRR
jgi:SLA1 homology domain 1, SHD1